METIDFVLCWVDGNDPLWLKRYNNAKGISGEANGVRFRDWGLLRYWFRAVEKYAPWVNKVYFVTDNQKPEWINESYHKLICINHTDYIPKEHLPAFNSNNIELNFHRIPGLSETFVAFNDDMFLNAPVTPGYFFKNGLPCDTPLEKLYDSCDYNKRTHSFGIGVTEYCCIQVLNAYFSKQDVIKTNPKGWLGAYQGFHYWLQAQIMRKRPYFNRFFTPHNEKAFLKSTFEEIWEKESLLMKNSCTTFRQPENMSIYLMRLWQLAKNQFHPTPFTGKRVIQINEDTIHEILTELNNPKIKSLCLNDSPALCESFYLQTMSKLQDAFERKFPQKSRFEK